MGATESSGARTRARELLLQALYRKQIAGHDRRELYDRVDQAFFDELLKAICDSEDELSASIARFIDRPIEQLDPVERGILLIGLYELENRIDIPYRVVINEGVNLARRFGATDGHKYINACLDAGAHALRTTETSG